MLEGQLDGGPELVLRACLGDPDRRAETSGLDEDGVTERVLRPLALPQRDVAGDRDAAVAHHRLEDVLVHRERRPEHPGADVRDPGQLEQALDGAVLAEGPVENREDDIHVTEGGRHLGGRHGQRLRDGAVTGAELPAPVAPDLDGDRVVALGIQGVEHGAGGGDGDLVLGAAAAHEHGHAHAAAHGTGVGFSGCVKRPTVILTVEPCGAC